MQNNLGCSSAGVNQDSTQANHNIEKEGKELEIAKETQKLNWYVIAPKKKTLKTLDYHL